MNRFRIASLLTLLLMVALILAACPASTPVPAAEPAAAETSGEEASGEEAPADEETKQIIFGLYQEPEILNAFIATQVASGEITDFVVEGLVRVDPDGNYFPQLAQEVPTVENGGVSEDGLTIRYNLLENVVWSDGEPFTCDDVVFTWEAVTSPESGAVSTTGYIDIESVTCEDDHTVIVQYEQFYAPYLTMFNAIMPRHATGEPADMATWAYNWDGLIGTGPFVLETWVSGDQIRLAANENYREYPAKPQIDEVIVRIIPSREVGKALITSGEIDILWDLTEADVPEFRENPDIVVNSVPGPGTERLVLNLADPTLDGTDDPINNPHPILADLRVRQAIELGIDKQFMVDELLFGETTVGSNELSIAWAQCDIPDSEYNPDQAIALLEEAGWTDEDGDGIRECHGCMAAEEGTPLRLKLQTTSGNQLREETQQILIEMMRDIGLEFYIENVPSAELFGSWASGAFRKHGQFDVVMYTTSDGIDPQSQMFGYFHSSQIPVEANAGEGFNYSRWINEEVDAALETAGSSPDEDVRRANYQIVCEKVAEDLPHIYLYDRSEIHLSRSRVQGFQVSAWDNLSWNAQDWDVE